MSDTEVATVLPKELRLGVPPKMPQARSYMFRQQSTISSYSAGQTIQINIPRLQRSYMRKDSYLRFTVSSIWTPQALSDTLSLDTCGAWGFFEKMEVFDYLGSTVLESISGVPQLMSLLLDLGLEGIIDKTCGNTSYGLAPDYGVNTSAPYKPTINGTVFANPSANGTTARTLSTAIPVNQSITIVPPSSGLLVDKAFDTNPQVWSTEFSIPLCSFLGFLSEKMIPLHNGFTIVLTLAPKNKPFILSQDYSIVGPTALVAGTANASSDVSTLTARTVPPVLDWNVNNVQMQLQILELGPIAESMIISSTQGQPLIVHTKAMRYYMGSVKGSTNFTNVPGTPEFTLNLNLNVASLTNILWFMRNNNSIDDAYYASCGHRTRNFLQKWYFQYGSTTLPQNNGIQAMYSTMPPLPSGIVVSGATPQYGVLFSGAMECYNELLKSRPYYLAANRINYNNYVSDFSWNKSLDRNTTQANGAVNYIGLYPGPHNPLQIGRFACGLNLELSPNKYGSIISGLNTNGMNTSIRGQFHPSYLTNMDDVTIDAYAEYDAFINISPGIATTVSF